VFSDYLSSVSPAWKTSPGTGKDLQWPVGLGAKGNEAVAGQVKQTPGSVGYVELAYVKQNKLSTASIQNAAGQFVAPSAACVSVAQDRILEKRFFVECAPRSGVMPAPHQAIASSDDIDAIPDELLPGILKTVRMGYDGKGQVRVRTRDDVREAFTAMGGVTCLLEKMLPLAYEVSVLTARGADGESVVYPIAENVHRERELSARQRLLNPR
jgi:phosphoribosylaminoimidazole carboxylase (NCAIR synthetase)